jgi:hypothetical protein
MKINKKNKSFSLILVLFLFSLSPTASAESQSVCINKKSGDIRVSDSCNNDESRGSLTIPPAKVSKVNKIKAQIQKLETDSKIQMEEMDREIRESFGFADGAMRFCLAMSDGSLTQMQGLNPLGKSICAQIRALDESNTKMLNNLNRQLQNELRGFKTITCKKANQTLTVTDLKPKCPKGFKLKA